MELTAVAGVPVARAFPTTLTALVPHSPTDRDGSPRLTTTVPRELVHRAALSEVFITGWKKAGGEAEFELSAQWPRCHSFFTPPASTHHRPMLVAETIRQAVFVLAHAEFGIPLGHHFVMSDLDYSTSRDGLRVGRVPTDIRLEARCSRLRSRGSQVTGFRTDLTLYHGEAPVASGGGTFDSVRPAVYRRLRADRHTAGASGLPLPPALSPEFAGRTSPLDVVLTPARSEREWLLRVDTAHPTMFDHAVDHVPGMVLIEAACQAASALAHPAPFHADTMTASFSRYAELDTPCTVTAEPWPTGGAATPDQVLVTGRQNGEQIFSTRLRRRPHQHTSFTVPEGVN